MPTILEDLEDELVSRPGQVVVLAGAGVAIASDTNPCASWTGLLQDGLNRCRERCHHLSENWFTITATMIAERSATEFIQAASRIQDALRRNHDGEFGRWLADSVGKLKLTDDRVVRGLLALGTRVATTNYDNLFEEASGLRAVTWLQGAQALRVLRGVDPGVLHLHGHFTAPDSVVFSANGYQDICRDPRAQNLLRSVFTRDTVIFVGCGAGVDDPNFGGLFEWSRDALRECHHTHYHLVRRVELQAVAKQYEGLRVTPVAFGDAHADLDPFLHNLAARVAGRRQTPSPLDLLAATHRDYEARANTLLQQRDVLTASEYVAQNFALARSLWAAGGRRTAAVHMTGTLGRAGKDLALADRVAYTLEAVEYLLDDEQEFRAGVMIEQLEKELGSATPDSATLARFRRLQTRCLNEGAQLPKLIKVIQDAIPLAEGEERARLEADLTELHLLSGSLPDAERAARGDR